MPSSSYTVQTPAFEEVTGQPVQAGAQALDREDGGTPKKYDPRLTRSPPNTARSGRSSYRYRTGKSLNFLGKATPANSTTIYNNERIPRPHREVKRAEKPKTINELMETPEGRYLFKKIGDKMMQNAKGGKLREQFRKFDLDKNGSVDYDELRTGLTQMNFGLSEEQFRMLCAAVDKDGGGEIDYDEFMQSFDAWQPLGDRDDAHTDNISTCAPWELVHGDWEIMKKKPRPDEIEKAMDMAAADSAHIRKHGRHVHSSIADRLNQHERVLKKMFDNFDADGSGDLDHGELREGLKHAHLNLRPEDIAKFVAYADRDSGGTIDIDEFMAHFATPDYGHPQAHLYTLVMARFATLV